MWYDRMKEGNGPISNATANEALAAALRPIPKGGGAMHIYVDADACPVVRIVEATAQRYGIPCTLLCDTNHVLTTSFSEVRVIAAGADAVDFALIGLCRQGDLVVTQDYGVAAMALGKKAYAIHPSGTWYMDENIDRLLMERHLARKARRASGKNHLNGPKKRTAEDDERFAASFDRMVQAAQNACACAPMAQER